MPTRLKVSLEGAGEFSARFEDRELQSVAEKYGREIGVGFLVQQVLLNNEVDIEAHANAQLDFKFEEIPTVASTISNWFAKIRGSYLVRKVVYEVRSALR